MNYDKETKIVIGICVVLLLAWAVVSSLYNTRNAGKPVKTETSESGEKLTTVQKADSEKTAVEDTVAEDVKKADTVKVPSVSIPKTIKTLADVSLQNDTFQVNIDPNKGGLKSIVLNTHLRSNANGAKIALDKDLNQEALSVTAKGKWTLLKIDEEKSESGEYYNLKRLFVDEAGQKFELIQNWTLDKNYQLSYDVELVNRSSKELLFKQLTVNVGGMPPSSRLSGDNVRMEHHNVDFYLKDDNSVKSISADGEDEELKELGVTGWVSVSNKYFACMLFAQKPFADGVLISRVKKDLDAWSKKKVDEYYVVSAAGSIGSVRLAPNGSEKWTFKYYAGPKELAQLELLEPNASEILRLGWSWLAPICKFLLGILIYFKTLTSSWGISIILLTIVVKAILWPLTHKANVSMKKMQKLQPMMKELREQYKDNQQMQSMKMMELYKEHKVNPLGGCLPILLQFPVFVALYFTFDGSVEMRQASFLWAKDLAQPDTIAVIAGLAINPLVIVWTGLLMVQQLMTPTSMDPAQQKMMVFMPVVMLFVLYNFPAGVTLYYTVSQIISLIQLFINKKLYKDDDIGAKPATA